MTPEGWRELAIGDFAEVKTGGTPRRDQERFWRGPIPWMSSGEVHKRLIWDTEESITESALAESNARWLPEGSVVVALNGQGRTRGMAALLCAPMTCNQSLAAILPSEGVVPRFLLGALEAKYAALRGLTGDTGRNGLNLDLVRSVRLLVPPLGEQRKIAAILSAMDEAIEATQAVIDQLQVAKKAMMADLLTRGAPGRHTQFKQTEIGAIPDTWTVARLRDCIREPIRNGYSPVCSLIPTGRSILHLGAVSFDGFDSSAVKHAPPDDARIDRSLLEPGDVLVSRSNTRARVGLAGLYEGVPSRCAYPDLLMRVRTNDNLLPKYLEAQLLSARGRTYFETTARGTSESMVKIDREILGAFMVARPPRDEQQGIVDILRAMDERRRQERATLAALHTLKAALMSALLTGELRVPPDEAAA